MTSWLQRLLGGSVRATGPLATEDDVYYCYRLFLRREPDAEGFRHYMQKIKTDHIGTDRLIDEFMNSPEFRSIFLGRGGNGVLYNYIMHARDTIQLVSCQGFDMYIRPDDLFIGALIVDGKPYEQHITTTIQQHLRPGNVFLDIGANIGYFVLLGSSLVGPQGRVIGFEPNPSNAELVRMSIEHNHFTQTTLHQQAVSDRHDYFVLESEGSNGWLIPEASGTAVPGQEGNRPTMKQRYRVEAVALDDVLPDLDHVDLLKIDIEGSEPRALRGMDALIKRCRPTILTEFSPDLISAISNVHPKEYLEMLRSYGYALAEIQTNGASSAVLTNDEIMQRYTAANASHIDLMAIQR